LKAENEWNDKSFMALLKLLKDILFEDNELLDRIYDAKKIISSMSMNYERIHTCPNDYFLFQNDYEELESYTICEVDRYKENKKKVPAKV